MVGLDLSMLQSAATKRSTLAGSDEVEMQSEHPAKFALAPVRDVRSERCFSLPLSAVLCFSGVLCAIENHPVTSMAYPTPTRHFDCRLIHLNAMLLTW